MGILGVVAQADQLLTPSANAYCPTTECRFPEITSLAACAKCESEPVQATSFNCSGEYITRNGTSNYQDSHPFSTYSDFRSTIRDYLDKALVEVKMQCIKQTEGFPPFPINISLEFRDVILEEISGHITIRNGLEEASLLHRISSSDIGQERNATSNQDGGYAGSYLRACANPGDEFSIDYYADQYDETDPYPDPARIASFTCFNSTTDLMLYNNLDHIGQINGTISRCSIDLCARSSKKSLLRNGAMETQWGDDVQLKSLSKWDPSSSDKIITLVDRDQDPEFADRFYIGDLDRSTLQYSLTETTSNSYSWLLYSLGFLQNTNGNFTQLFHGIADAISTVIQSPHNPNVTNITAVAYGPEVFVQVRWAWFVMPLALVFASISFLVATILQSRCRSYLFKTSLLPMLFYGVEGPVAVEEKNKLHAKERVTYEDMMKVAGGIGVRFERDDKQNFKLKRE